MPEEDLQVYDERIDRHKKLQEENEILAKHILELQKDKGVLTDKVAELESQIEKLTYLPNGMEKDKYIEQIERANKNLWEDIRSKNKQIEKAKELLKRCYENYIYLNPLRSEIRKFLHSGVEKELQNV